MPTGWPFAGSLLTGPLCQREPWPCTLHVRLGDLRPRFLVKQTIAARCRAIARNGRVLLCADRPLVELCGSLVRLRLQTWHRVYLPGEIPEPHGVLLCVRVVDEERTQQFKACLRPIAEATGELRVDVGGGMVLDLCADKALKL
jgi:hypothetical protein